MQGTAVSMLLALTILVSRINALPTSAASQASVPPAEICTDDEIFDWEHVAEKPTGKLEWEVLPIPQAASPDSTNRILYLVVITLGPGKCIPYASPANQKNGPVILIVQQGSIEFTAQQFSPASAAVVAFGDPNVHEPGEDPATQFAFGTTQVVEVDQWVSQNDQVWFTYKNPGPSDAVIWKVVWADMALDGGEGCGGNCK